MSGHTAQENKQVLDIHGRPYPSRQPDGYIQPGLATDSIVTRGSGQNLSILLIKRGRGAFIGKLAFPGGKIDYYQKPQKACLRQLSEECGFAEGVTKIKRLIDVRGDPLRDPRKHMVSVIYEVEAEEDAKYQAGDDASDANFVSVKQILGSLKESDFAFDHYDILMKYLQRLKSENSLSQKIKL